MHVDVVKEFYANMVGMKDKIVYVRCKWISFNREQTDQTHNLQERKNGLKFKKLVKEPDFQKIVDLLTDGKGKWNATRKNPHESIARGTLTEKAKVWFYFLCSIILPSKHLCIVKEKEAVLLYAILKGYKFSVGKIIENSFLSYYRGGCKGLIPHPALITRLCILGGDEGDWEKEENCPRTSPLTLTGITKGLKNRGREREAKVTRDEEEHIEINQMQLKNEGPEKQQRQRSVSPILTLSPNVRQAHWEQAGSSEHQSNNAELMEMLRAMRQEMQERDNQLKVQLQLRDENLDVEVKRKDHNLKEALRLRDEEWKNIWEIRE